MIPRLRTSVVQLADLGVDGDQAFMERVHGTELRIGGFPLSLRAVHSPEQAGEVFGVDRRHLPDRGTRSFGLLHLGVEGTVSDGGTKQALPGSWDQLAKRPALSSRSRVAAFSFSSVAARISSSWATLLAPGTGMIAGWQFSSHASTTWFGVAPCSAATSRRVASLTWLAACW